MRLLRIEWLKLKNYKPFWVLMGLYPVVLLCIIAFLLRSHVYLVAHGGETASTFVFGSAPFAFPRVWHVVTYTAGFLHFFPCVVILLGVCNDFQFRTHRQNLLDGWSRSEYYFAKLLVMVFVLLYCLSWVVLSSLALGFFKGNSAPGLAGLEFVAYFWLQSLVYAAFAVWIGFFFQRGLICVAFFLIWNVLEKIISYFLSWQVAGAGYFAPLAAVNTLIPVPLSDTTSRQALQRLNLEAPEITTLTLVACAYLVVFLGGTYLSYRRRDL